MGIPGADPCS